METKEIGIKPIELKWVTRTYRGKSGCACGCGGTYKDAGSSAASMRVAFINKNLENPNLLVDVFSDGETCYELENREGTRVTRVYVAAGH